MKWQEPIKTSVYEKQLCSMSTSLYQGQGYFANPEEVQFVPYPFGACGYIYTIQFQTLKYANNRISIQWFMFKAASIQKYLS